jgi:hypothetical protein
MGYRAFHLHMDELAIAFDANGAELRIQKVRTLTKHTHTLIGWSVASIEQAVRALIAQWRGVRALSVSAACL